MFCFMKCSSGLTKLNSGKGTLIILRILIEQSPIDKMTLRKEALECGIGGSAFDSTMEICYDLKLVTYIEERYHIRGGTSLLHSLTDKGRKIAEKIREVDQLLF